MILLSVDNGKVTDLNLDEIRARTKEMRALGHRAVTEGVNLKYVDQMRQALYAAADEQDALLDRLSTLQTELDAAEGRYREGTQRFVDHVCHYRNLAIKLGAKPENMLGKYDRDLAANHTDNDEDGVENTAELWEDLEAAEARVAELTKALERIALGIEGRRQSGFLPGESDGMPATDWMLAREALKKP